ADLRAGRVALVSAAHIGAIELVKEGFDITLREACAHLATRRRERRLRNDLRQAIEVCAVASQAAPHLVEKSCAVSHAHLAATSSSAVVVEAVVTTDLRFRAIGSHGG